MMLFVCKMNGSIYLFGDEWLNVDINGNTDLYLQHLVRKYTINRKNEVSITYALI